MQNPRYALYLKKLAERDWTTEQIFIIAACSIVLWLSLRESKRVDRLLIWGGVAFYYVSLVVMVVLYFWPGFIH